MEDNEYAFLSNVPDQRVVNDVLTYIHSEKHDSKHFFSHIHEGRVIRPDNLTKYHVDNNKDISLYMGGFGHGYYSQLLYDIERKEYVYYGSSCDQEGKQELFSSSSWDSMVDYVTKNSP